MFIYFIMKLNNIGLIVAVIVIMIWMFHLYKDRCKNIEKYTSMANTAKRYLDKNEKLNPGVVMARFLTLSGDRTVADEAFTLAKMNDKEGLYALLEEVKKANPRVENE